MNAHLATLPAYRFYPDPKNHPLTDSLAGIQPGDKILAVDPTGKQYRECRVEHVTHRLIVTTDTLTGRYHAFYGHDTRRPGLEILDASPFCNPAVQHHLLGVNHG